MKKLLVLPRVFMAKRFVVGFFALFLLNNMALAVDDDTINAIAKHGWAGHRTDFPKIASEKHFATYIKALTVDNATVKKDLSDGREAFWRTPVIVISDPNNPTSKGTCFKPGTGKKYYDGLKE